MVRIQRVDRLRLAQVALRLADQLLSFRGVLNCLGVFQVCPTQETGSNNPQFGASWLRAVINHRGNGPLCASAEGLRQLEHNIGLDNPQVGVMRITPRRRLKR